MNEYLENPRGMIDVEDLTLKSMEQQGTDGALETESPLDIAESAVLLCQTLGNPETRFAILEKYLHTERQRVWEELKAGDHEEATRVCQNVFGCIKKNFDMVPASEQADLLYQQKDWEARLNMVKFLAELNNKTPDTSVLLQYGSEILRLLEEIIDYEAQELWIQALGCVEKGELANIDVDVIMQNI